MPCERVATLALPDTTITSAAVAPDGASCWAHGVFAPSDQFEVWLPTIAWNGKFMGVGSLAGGGLVDTILGIPPRSRAGTRRPAPTPGTS